MSDIKISEYYYHSPVGGIILKADDLCVRSLSFAGESVPKNENEENRLIKEIVKQLDEYFSGKRKHFNLPLGLHYNSVFQRLVWVALMEIPFGGTRSYKEIAISIGRPTVFRAVGNACGQNLYPIIVPCHRVISAKGGIGGFSASMEIKVALQELENKYC